MVVDIHLAPLPRAVMNEARLPPHPRVRVCMFSVRDRVAGNLRRLREPRRVS